MVRTIDWTPEFLAAWAKDRAEGQQATNHPKVERLEWRDYNMSWQNAYWDLVYKRGSYTSLLREQNLMLTARVMELELTLRLKDNPLDGLKSSRYYRNDNE